MKKLISAAVLLVLCMSIYAQSSVLTIKPSQIETGKDVRFTYTGKLAKEGTTIDVKLYTAKSFIITTIETKLIGESLEGKFNVPDSIIYVSFIITNGVITDRKDKESVGYDFNVFKAGKPVKGTYLIQGALLSSLGGGNKAIDLIEKEYALYPEQREKTFINYVYALSNIKDRKAEAIALAQKKFDSGLQSGANETDLSDLIRVIYNGNYQKRDSLEQKAIKKFPKGRISLWKKLSKFYDFNDPDKILLGLDTLRNEFPEKCEEEKSSFDQLQIKAYRIKKDYANFDKYMSNVKDKGFKAYGYNEIAWEMVSNNTHLEIAKVYSEKSLELMDSLRKEKKPDYCSLRDWEDSQNATKGNYYNTYGWILDKMGYKKEATENELLAVELTKSNDVYMNEHLVRLLVAGNQMKEALSWSEKFLSSDKSNAKIDSLYDVAYIKLNGSNAGLADAKAKMIEKMKPAPDFTLKTLDGKTVTLSALRGKIVILDLWATWCRPCLASFSGMQKAIDALKEDKDVCFYFINTFERTTPEERLKDIKKTIEIKKVNFDILLDEQKGYDFLVAKQFNVTGIPSKIIIDKNGKIRSTLGGYGGNDVELVNELKSIVEKLH
jgi:peroxiredoxin